MNVVWRWLCFATAGLAAGAAQAGQSDGWPARLLDHPVRVQKIKAGTGADPLPEVICTSYADLMVHESGTDSPAPDAATLAPIPAHAKPPACGRKAPAGAVVLKTEDFGFLGRRGPYLFFEASDPNGAVPFMVVDAAFGHTLVSDSTKDGHIQTLAVENGTLRMRFTRGVNGSCSLAKDAGACWATMAHDGQIPAAIGKLPPPQEACAASYRKGKVPADDPSLVFFAVDLKLAGTGPAETVPSGPIGCEPLP